jgi:hypothetical protein
VQTDWVTSELRTMSQLTRDQSNAKIKNLYNRKEVKIETFLSPRSHRRPSAIAVGYKRIL